MLDLGGRCVCGVICVLTLFLGAYGDEYDEYYNTLYVSSDPHDKNIITINRNADDGRIDIGRAKRDVGGDSLPISSNISTWITHLNDSHQQLLVQWVGVGSNVIICLARDSTLRNKGSFTPSAVYISYNYGQNFTNRTDNFRLSDDPDSDHAQLDKFFNHPKYPEFSVFIDSKNQKVFYSNDNGKTIHRSDVNFHPSELAFDEDIPNKFVVLDKINTRRNLYMTVDGGKTFKLVQSFVKNFFWTSGPGVAKMFHYARWKPNGNSTVFTVSDPMNMSYAIPIFEDAKDFQIKGDYMFATKTAKFGKTIDLYISHQRAPFFKAEFVTELDLRKIHIADVTDKRIFISVMHTETLAHLYVSEISMRYTKYLFMLSLENVLCYFPDGNWEDSWLEDATEEPFTDLYRVEGLHGIYIASRVDSKAPVANIGPEHLVSLITFDHGARWSPIKAPTEDENGKPLNCHIENSCSLHLCQKFSQLYPATSTTGNVTFPGVTRSASIMSSKSAPGIIMATGVMGKSLKGFPGVFLSRDAGLTWKRILKDYYFFNYGDHGGILAAVKYFKFRGGTKEILYSTNEGLTWDGYPFHADDLRIYGLMTEPGENTTTFTMFGSASEHHQWIIITIDLKKAFARDCVEGDYKFWSPAPPNTTVSCVLGSRDTFHRRLAHTNCFNGLTYERPIKKEICECGRRDYECDRGFLLTRGLCIRNTTMKYNAYSVPSYCMAGSMYTRTKGYRKIDGDVCVSSTYSPYDPDRVPCPMKIKTEFLLVAIRDKIARIDLSTNITDFPVTDQKQVVALEFDMANNCMYWADIEVDQIYRQCFNNGTTREVFIDKDLSSIEGMALDWISNILFFVDGSRKKIEAVRTDIESEGRMRVTIHDSKVLSKPRGIAVHPKAGYLFWTDWDRQMPSVSRSSLDGTSVKKLFTSPMVQWPNGITIDLMSERIYWVDAMEDYIASSNLDGHYVRFVLRHDEKVSHPFAIAVLKDHIYWDDWKARSVFAAEKNSGANVKAVNNSFNGLMDLKVFAHYTQHGTNACSFKNTSCNTICLGNPSKGFSCLCPDGFDNVNNKCMCPNGLEPNKNMTCPMKEGGGCSENQFACANGRCINKQWQCNNFNDCGDNSDEADCTICSPTMFSCADNKKCYKAAWRCDGDNDCEDMSDEKDCMKNCTAEQFRCDNSYCIPKTSLCDGDNDCRDGSDEKNCFAVLRPVGVTSCSVNSFRCANGTRTNCIPISWMCDGDRDCPDGEDELSAICNINVCASHMFRCPSGKCINKNWRCDHENDCQDAEASDEKNCTDFINTKILPRYTTEHPDFSPNVSCPDWMFRCENGNCLPYWWRCDGVNDCEDNSDEFACADLSPEYIPEPARPRATTSTTTPSLIFACTVEEFTCAPEECIPQKWVCDSRPDCMNGADERDCAFHNTTWTVTCGPDETLCDDGISCVRYMEFCDGRPQCPDGKDEEDCIGVPYNGRNCNSGFFLCRDLNQCISNKTICNGYVECPDGIDERNCSSTINRDFFNQKFLSIGVDQGSINSTSFLVSCWMVQKNILQNRFLPSISKVADGLWTNLTWTNDSIYRFTDLEPFTNYNVTFFIQDSRTKRIYPSDQYVNTTTGEDVPSAPLRISVRQMTGSQVNVIWDPPAKPNGHIQYYTVQYAPPIPPASKKIFDTNVILSGYFIPEKNYSFWVTATNGAATSESSNVSYLTFDDVGDVDDLSNVSMHRANDTSVYLEWHKIRGVEGFIIEQRYPSNYIQPAIITTKALSITLIDLPPGITMYVDISAYKGQDKGRPFTITVNTSGVPEEVLKMSVFLFKNDTVSITWNPPKDDRYANKNVLYNVYYGILKSKMPVGYMPNETKIVTNKTGILINNLKHCQSYLFTVGIVGGPLASPIEIITRSEPRSPIKNLSFNITSPSDSLNIYWNSNCDVMKEPLGYMVNVLEESRNEPSKYALAPTTNTSLHHVIEKIPTSSRFNICVFTDVPNSVKQCVTARAPTIPAPTNVVAWVDNNGNLMVTWSDSDKQKPCGSQYEIFISLKVIKEQTLNPESYIQMVRSEFSPIVTTVPSNEKGPFYVSVRCANGGYYSDLTEVQTMPRLGAEASTSSAGVWWGATFACIAIVILCAATAHFVLRYRRYTRNFLRFTSTPRYNCRRGQATIADQEEEEDMPTIHGFSDDEPLVIA